MKRHHINQHLQTLLPLLFAQAAPLFLARFSAGQSLSVYLCRFLQCLNDQARAEAEAQGATAIPSCRPMLTVS